MTTGSIHVLGDGAGDLNTRFAFTLPNGYVDREGTVHTSGIMRLATARDEIMPLRDPRVRDNMAYLAIILLSRVVERIGDVEDVNPGVIEGLFAADLAYLQRLYQRLNREGDTTVVVRCPHCQEEFAVDTADDAPGES